MQEETKEAVVQAARMKCVSSPDQKEHRIPPCTARDGRSRLHSQLKWPTWKDPSKLSDCWEALKKRILQSGLWQVNMGLEWLEIFFFFFSLFERFDRISSFKRHRFETWHLLGCLSEQAATYLLYIIQLTEAGHPWLAFSIGWEVQLFSFHLWLSYLLTQ